MPPDPPPVVLAAQHLAGLGWPVMPVKPRSKEPLTAHGVKDATTTERTILHWFERWPDANLAIACGAPGPQVLDVDDPDRAKHVVAQLQRLHVPTAATARGWHRYFQGTDRGTISLGFGELRGKGSYVLVPPSIHPSGKEYVWLEPPTRKLPPVPDLLAGQRTTAGVGDHEPKPLIAHGERHDALKDVAVRFLRGGFTDPTTLEQMIASFFRMSCEQTPPPRKNEFRDIARWAAKSDIAEREREAAEFEQEPPKKDKKTKKSKLDKPPAGDAPLAEHRAYVRKAGGWSDRIDIKHVRRYGIRGADGIEIDLTNGQQITFDRQDQVTTRGHWPKTIVACTNGIADPLGLTDWEAVRVFRSLCLLADAPPERREAEDLRDVVTEFVALCEAIPDHDLSTSEGRYEATARCHARGAWDPKARTDHQPVLLIDKTGARYIRAGELRDYLNYRGLGISAGAVSGRMQMIGAHVLTINGREQARPDRAGRRTNHMRLYQLPAEGT